MPDAEGLYRSSNEIKRLISGLTKDLWSRTQRTYAGFSDENLYLPSRSELEKFLATTPVRMAMALGEGFDCDDYSFVLKGAVSLYGRDVLKLRSSMCIGITWGQFAWSDDAFHAANWVVTAGMELLWIEPQDRSVHAISDCRGELRFMVV